MNRQLICGILAHVDAGKTTLTEALLYHAGCLRSAGRVDRRTAFLDTDTQERARGITIFSKQAVLPGKGFDLVLTDTPGHFDFSGEAERALEILDYAVLVVSGADGVQAHTRTLWELLRSRAIPTLVFVNKMDLAHRSRDALMKELCSTLSADCVDYTDFNSPALQEALAAQSEPLLEQWLREGCVDKAAAVRLIAQSRVFPCLFGAALPMQGTQQVLDFLRSDTVLPQYPDAFAARVFKITHDERQGRLTWLKITGGSLAVKQSIEGACADGSTQWKEKAEQLRVYSGAKHQTVQQLCAGCVCAVAGLSHTYAGQGLGCEKNAPPAQLRAVMRCRVLLPKGGDVYRIYEQLRLLEQEEPQLNVSLRRSTGEIFMQLMGQMQQEIVQQLAYTRFGLELCFDEGRAAYAETIAAPVQGVGHFEPLRHYAEVRVLLEPGPRGSGIQVKSSCPVDRLAHSWQQQVLACLMQHRHLGVLTGSPLTDVVITLADGLAHQKHTEGGDFREAACRAVRQALMQAQSVLLEPWYAVRIELPPDCVGRAMADLQRMGGECAAPQVENGQAVLTGCAPAAQMQDYAIQLAAYSRGHGRLSCAANGLRPCASCEQAVQEAGYCAEQDSDHTADSVFCSHGAGYHVPWHQVEQHAHTPRLKLGAQKQDQPYNSAPRAGVRAAGAQKDTLAADAELAQIFERTYGSGKRSSWTPPRPAPVLDSRPVEPVREYLLVDGYNIIFAWDELREESRDSMEAARQRLADLLCNYCAYQDCEVILVFDAYCVKGGAGSVQKYHNIHIVYTKEAETADLYIEKITYELARKRRVRVATSDGLEQMIIAGHGALRISAQMLYEEVKLARQRAASEIAEHNRRNNLRLSAAKPMHGQNEEHEKKGRKKK